MSDLSQVQVVSPPALVPIEYRGQRVITLSTMDAVHGRPDGTARKRFNDHKDRMVDGRHYFVLNPDEAARILGKIAPNGMNVLTEFGYLLLVKSFTDDRAWEVQERLVDTYFRVRTAVAESPSEAVSVHMFKTAMQTMSETFIALTQQMEERINRRSEQQHQEWLAASHIGVAHGLTVGELAKEFRIQGVRGLSIYMSNRLVRCGCQLESRARAHAGASRAKLFHPDKARAVMLSGFAEDCRRYVAERRGQRVLPFQATKGT